MKKAFLRVILFFLLSNVFAVCLAEIPFILDDDDKMLIWANVNNNEGYYIFDTGAYDIFVFDSLENLFEVKTENTWILGKYQPFDYYALNSVSFGDSVFEGNFLVAQLLEEKQFFSESIKGIIGLSIFGNMNFEISFSKKNIYLYNSYESNYSDFCPLLCIDNMLYIQGSFDGSDDILLIDTGDSDCIKTSLRDIYSSRGILFKKVFCNPIREFAAYEDYYLFNYKKISIFDREFFDVLIFSNTTFAQESTGILGMGFLKKYDLFFNRDDKKLYYKFINDKDTPIIVENKPISGILRIDIDFQTFEIIIAEIIENSPSFNAGLRLNDRISAINNYTISELSIDSVINMLRSENISLDVKRDSGKEKLSFFIEKIF